MDARTGDFADDDSCNESVIGETFDYDELLNGK